MVPPPTAHAIKIEVIALLLSNGIGTLPVPSDEKSQFTNVPLLPNGKTPTAHQGAYYLNVAQGEIRATGANLETNCWQHCNLLLDNHLRR
jgi:hypothetical protein